jgi:hypothetical protein
VRTLLVLLLLTTIAHAQPVRDDIVDVRHQRSPQRRIPLGWTADNRFVVHVADCNSGDGRGPFCMSALELTDAGGKTEQITLFDVSCNPCERSEITTDLAMTAIRTERDQLRLLGTLTPSPLASKPDVKLTSTSCRLDLRHGKRRLKFELGDRCLFHGGSEAIEWASLLDVTTSPDGGTLAITVVVALRFGEWTNPHTMVFMLRK